LGSSGRFRYVDARGNAITDADKLERIRALVIPPAWKDVWISPGARAKLQATGVDAAGRRQYLYHADFRARQEQAKFDKLIRFAERLPDLRAATSEHMGREELDRLRVSAIATRLINAGWFRVGSERYAKESRTYGITTLGKSHVHVRGKPHRVRLRRKHRTSCARRSSTRSWPTTSRSLLALPAAAGSSGTSRQGRCTPDRRAPERLRARLPRRRVHGEGLPHVGRDADRGDRASPSTALPRASARPKKVIPAVMRRVGKELGNTPAVARSSYVSPAVIDQYLDGRTIEDFRPRHLRVVRARDSDSTRKNRPS
jgi:DNA topoisomerase IB